MMQALAVGHKTALTSEARPRPSSWWRRQTASPIRRANQLWQTAFTDLIVIGWRWYSRTAVLDDFSRCILAQKLYRTMATADMSATLEIAL